MSHPTLRITLIACIGTLALAGTLTEAKNNSSEPTTKPAPAPKAATPAPATAHQPNPGLRVQPRQPGQPWQPRPTTATQPFRPTPQYPSRPPYGVPPHSPPNRLVMNGGGLHQPLSRPQPLWHPVNPRRPVIPMNQHLARCAHGIAQVAGCAVWARVVSPDDRSHLELARQQARSANGVGHEVWTGADGLDREVWIIPGPEMHLTDVELLPLGMPPGADAGYEGSATPQPQYQAPPQFQPQSQGTTPPMPSSSPGTPVAATGTDRICRTVQTNVTVGDSTDEAQGLQCRDNNGDWTDARQLSAGQ